MDFSYEIINGQVRINKVGEPDEIVVVPETVGGYPVTELGAYVMAESDVEELHLPPEIKKIGAYAFYGCEKLRQIHCFGRIADLGAGLFAGARNVEFLDFTFFDGERSCLKDLLSELRQTLRVQAHEISASPGKGAREARLIFPEYFEDSVENTPARIVPVQTHGCGHRYRYCFVKNQFQYKDYDELFPHVKVQEPEELVTELALGRLLYPEGMTERHGKMYREYVAEHWKTAGQLLIGADAISRGRLTNLDEGKLPWLVEEILAGGRETPVPGDFGEKPLSSESGRTAAFEGQLADLIIMAQQAGDTEMVSWLMDYRHKKTQGAEVFPAVSAAAAPAPRRRRRFEL